MSAARLIACENNLYVGFMVLIPGVAALLRLEDRNMRGLLVMVVMALLIAVGNATPAFHLFDKFLPGFAGLRIHGRTGFLISFTLLVAFAWWLSQPARSTRQVRFLIGVSAGSLVLLLATLITRF